MPLPIARNASGHFERRVGPVPGANRRHALVDEPRRKLASCCKLSPADNLRPERGILCLGSRSPTTWSFSMPIGHILFDIMPRARDGSLCKHGKSDNKRQKEIFALGALLSSAICVVWYLLATRRRKAARQFRTLSQNPGGRLGDRLWVGLRWVSGEGHSYQR